MIALGAEVQGLSHRGEGVRHGVTVVVRGRLTEQRGPEWWMQYHAPIEIEGKVLRGGWFRENELTVR